VEYIYQAYHQRIGEFVSESFWNRHLITGINTVDTLVVEDGQTLPLAWDKLTFAPGQSVPRDPGGTSVTWTVTPGNIAEVVDSTGAVTGLEVGYATARGTLLSTPTSYLKSTWLNMPDVRHEVPVKVIACSGGTPRVIAITVDQEPAITTPGEHWFTATAVGCANGYEWIFIPSFPWLAGDTVITPGATASFDVEDGDYTLTVTATPIGGIPLIRFVNVCADNGGLPLYEGSGLPGDPGTNAAGGC